MYGISMRSGNHRERRERRGVYEPKYWDEEDPNSLRDAVADACRIYEYRNLRENLRNLSWKRARKRALAHGALSNEWVGHKRGDVRLRRGGLEVRFRSGTKRLGWQRMQELVWDEWP